MKKVYLMPMLYVLLIMIYPVVWASSDADADSYVLDMSGVPASMRAYAEENPESFETNMNDLMAQGYSEAEALSVMEKRLASNLDKIETEKERDRFLKEIEAVPNIQQAIVRQDPELYKAAKRKLASGLPVSGNEEKLLGIRRGEGGLYRPVSDAHPDHLKDELAYANATIQYNQAVAKIQSMVRWLRTHCPPSDMPAVNTDYANDGKTIFERSQLALAEKKRIGVHYSFYKRQADERAAMQKQIKELEAQLARIQSRLAKIENNQHWH